MNDKGWCVLFITIIIYKKLEILQHDPNCPIYLLIYMHDLLLARRKKFEMTNSSFSAKYKYCM